MYCEECKMESTEETVCNNCGLVFEEMFIKTNLVPRSYDDSKEEIDLSGSFRGPLSPDIEYEHIYPKHSKNESLNRAFNRQRQEKKKTEKHYYFRDMKDIERVCQYLQLPEHIIQEALSIRKQIGKNSNYFKYKKKYYKNMACIKVAARIHDYPLNEKNFIELVRNYPLIKKGDIISLRGNEAKKEIDKKYIDIIHNQLKLILLSPIKPKFISYACSELNIPQYEYKLYEIYKKINKWFNPSCSLRGYILGLIHILYGKNEKIRMIDLENKFNTNRLTIVNRKKELIKMLEVINNTTLKG